MSREPHHGPSYQCPWCTALYAHPQGVDDCRCQQGAAVKYECVHGIEWSTASSAAYCDCDDDDDE